MEAFDVSNKFTPPPGELADSICTVFFEVSIESFVRSEEECIDIDHSAPTFPAVPYQHKKSPASGGLFRWHALQIER